MFMSSLPEGKCLRRFGLPAAPPAPHHHLICKLGLSTCCARSACLLFPRNEHVASILHFPKRLLFFPPSTAASSSSSFTYFSLFLFLYTLHTISPISGKTRLDSTRFGWQTRVYSFIVYSQLSCSSSIFYSFFAAVLSVVIPALCADK